MRKKREILAGKSAGGQAPAVLLPERKRQKMDEKNNTPNPKTKKSLGMLIMILALVLVVVILVIVIVASSGGDDTTTPGSSSDPAVTDTSDGTDSTTPAVSSSTPTSSTPPATTPKPPVDPVDPSLTETPSVAGEDGKVTVNSDTAGNGALILINGTHPYAYQTDKLFQGTNETKYEDVKAAGFERVSAKFPAPTAGHFLRIEAFDALDALITTFESVSGTSKTFLVYAYTAAYASALTDGMVTGNVVRLYINGDSGTYGFNYGSKKVTVSGTSMTYESWFKQNCAKYGFVYEGLVGSDENHQAGQFRYVGSIHAAGIQAAGSLEKYLADVKAGTVKTATAADGSTWTVSYVAASSETTTEIDVGSKATYVLSGDNMGGFILAVKNAAAQ